MNNEIMPKHVAIILDGNGRWATKRGLKRSEGHAAGDNNLKKLSEYILNKGIKVLSVFAFSTENFKRSEEEVNYLMDLFVKKFKAEKKYFKKKNIKVIFSGRKDPLRFDVIKAMEDLAFYTKDNTGGIFNICLNYGGQAEIIDAALKIANDLENFDENNFSKYLYNDLPEIDFLIRTSGEQRISNFMLYQAAYAELYFTDTYFPDFDEKEFDIALDEYFKRNRRFGGNNKK